MHDTSCPVGADTLTANRPMPPELSEDSVIIDRTETASQLIDQLNRGADGLIINRDLSAFRGGLGSAGVYQVNEGDGRGAPYCIPRNGIVLSTGDVRDYVAGPSEGDKSSGGDTFWGRGHGSDFRPDPETDDELLLRRISDERILAAKNAQSVQEGYHDVARLDIYFSIDTLRVNLELTFDLVFASEEYEQYVDSAFVDAFGIFVNGRNVAEFNGQPLNVDHSDMRFFAGTELNGVCVNADDPVLQNSIPMTGMNCGIHSTARDCASETFGQTGEACDSSGCDYTVCHWDPTTATCYNTLTYIIADTFDSAVDTTVYIMSLGADIDCTGVEPPAHGDFCRSGCTVDACAPSGVLLDKKQCVFECDPGYTYNEGFVECRTGSHVSHALCHPDPCTGLEPPMHGSLIGPCADGQLASGEQCIARCDDGYEIDERESTYAILTCAAGVASSVPTCIDYTPPRITCADVVHELSIDGACVNVDPESLIAEHTTATDEASGDDVRIAVDGDGGTRCFPVPDGQPWYHSLTYVATDQAGLSSTCDVHLFVWHMDCPEDTVIGTDPGSGRASLELPAPLYRGLSSAVATPVVSIEGPAFAGKHPGNVVSLDLAPGQHQLTYTASGTSLATATCTMTVTVQDSEPPELTCPQDIVMSAPATFDTTQAVGSLITATDNSGSPVEIAPSTANIATNSLGAQESPYSVDFIATVSDGLAGQTDSCSVDIHVWDIECPAPATVGMDVVAGGGGGRFIFPGLEPTGSWASRQTTTTVQVAGSPEIQTPFAEHFFPTNTSTQDYDVSYTVDIVGDSSKTCTSKVTVVDDLAPQMSCPTDSVSRVIYEGTTIQIDAASYIQSNHVTATDNSGSSPTITVEPDTAATYAAGEVELWFYATDEASNTVSCSFGLQVWSVECPAALAAVTEPGRDYSIVTLPSVSVRPSDPATEVDVTVRISGQASDLVPGASVEISLADSPFSLEYTVSFPGAPDEDVKTCTVPVTVQDDQPPQITCPAEVLLLAGNPGNGLNGNWAAIYIDAWVEGGQVAYSDNSGSVELSWQDSLTDMTEPLVVELQSDSYDLTLTATDDSGKTDTCDVAVYVWYATCNDLTASVRPLAQCDSAPCARLNLTAAGPNIAGNLEPESLTITPTLVGVDGMRTEIEPPYVIDIPVHDQQKVTYRIEDGAGHVVSCDSQITIVDDIPPSFDYCPSTREFPTGADVRYATFRASSFNMVARDNSGDAPDVRPSLSSDIEVVGADWKMDVSAEDQTVTFEARDGANLLAICEISVTATDTTAPIITCPGPYVRAVEEASVPDDILVDSQNEFIDADPALVTATDNSGEPAIAADPQVIRAVPGAHTIRFTATDETQTAECVVPVHVWNLRCGLSAITESCQPGQSFARVGLADAQLHPSVDGSTGEYATAITVQKAGGQSKIELLHGTEVVDVDLSESGTILTYTAEVIGVPNGAENHKTCTMIVNVEDTESPVIDCPSDVIVLANSSGYGVVSVADLTGADGPVQYSDNSDRIHLTWQDGQSDLTVPVVFPLQDDAQTLTFTVTEAAGNSLSATCEIPVYVWSMQCDEVATDPFVTSAPDREGTGDAKASVLIPFPTIRSMAVGDSRISAAGLTNAVSHDLAQAETLHLRVQAEMHCSGCAEPISFTETLPSFHYLPSRLRELQLEDSGTQITYTASSESDSWTDGGIASCVNTITIEDDEPPVFLSCPDHLWVQSDNLNNDISLQAELLKDEGLIVAFDNAGDPEIKVTTSVQPGQMQGQIRYTALQWTEHYGNRLSSNCTVLVTAWDVDCPEPITTTTSERVSVLEDEHGGEGNAHGSILIPPTAGQGYPIVRGAVPNQGVAIAVDVPGRSAPIKCLSIGDCGQVTEFPFLVDGGGALTYRVAINASNDNGNVVRAAVATCRTPVTVLDDENPQFCRSVEMPCPEETCQSQKTVSTDPGETFATIRPSEFMPQANDNSGLIVEMSSSPVDGYELSLDEHSIVVNFTATDTSGNTATCRTQVLVQDIEDPIFSRCPQSAQQYPMDLGRNERPVIPSELISRGVIVAVDNSGFEPDVSSPANAVLRSGTHQVTFTATDAAGNQEECDVTLSVTCAEVTGPIGQNSDWREPPPDRLTAGHIETFKVALNDFDGKAYVQDADVTATFTSVDPRQYTTFSFSARQLAGNVHSVDVNIPVAGRYVGKVTVTEHGGAEALVAEWPVGRTVGEVRAGPWNASTTTIGSVPVVFTAGAPSSLIVQTKDSLGNPCGVDAAGIPQSLLRISAWDVLGWETEYETLTDNADGTYSSQRVPNIVKAGSYLIDISMYGQRLAVTQPDGLRLIVLPEQVVDARKTTVEGGSFELPEVDRIPWFEPGCSSTEPVYLFFDIVPRDRFGNRLDSAADVGATFRVAEVDEQLPQQAVRRTGEHYKVRIDGVLATTYRLIVYLDGSGPADSVVGNSPYVCTFMELRCPAEMENELKDIRERLQQAMAGNISVALPRAIQHRFVTYQWNETFALSCQLAAVISFIFTLVVVLKVRKTMTTDPKIALSRQPDLFQSADRGWMMCIGIGCLLSCFSVIIFSSGQVPDKFRDADYRINDPLCDWEECALGEINDVRVSDEMCMLKDAAPSISFVLIWASIIIKLRREHTTMFSKNKHISNCRLGVELGILVAVQIAIKCYYYYTDPPRLHSSQDYLSGAVEPEPLDPEGDPLFPSNSTVHWRINPHFYCYSASAGYYWRIDAGYQGLLLLMAAVLAYLTDKYNELNAHGGNKRELETLHKALNETGSVSYLGRTKLISSLCIRTASRLAQRLAHILSCNA